MIIKQIYTYNNYRNFNYLIACPQTREAVAIDPLAYKLCIEEAKKNNFKIVAVINTHEHLDHIAGNDKIVALTGAKLYVPENAKNVIANVDIGLKEGDKINIGKSVVIEIIDTPGHTMSHICLLLKGEEQVLFCGDTIFNAGVGNCHNGGDPISLYNTIYKKLINLNEKTKIYPGHDYLKTNLQFTLSLEPSNLDAINLLKEAEKQNYSTTYVSSLENEFKVNVFFRLKETSIIKSLEEKGFISKNHNSEDVFIALRELRNTW